MVKERLQKKLLDTNFVKPFLGATGQIQLDKKTIEEAYIDLAVIDDEEADKRYENSDREYQLNILRSNKAPVTLQEIVTENDQFVFISGVAGIGKSTLVKKMVLEWKEGRLFNGKNGSPYMQLVLPILCRELNKLVVKTNETPQEIIHQIFPDLPTMEVLQSFGCRVLFIIDGIDELRDVNNIYESSEYRSKPLLNFIHELLSFDLTIHHKCIIIGRPHVVRPLCSFCRNNFSYTPRNIEVCGFNEENVRKYIHNQLEDTALADKIIDKIERSLSTKTLMSVPLYAWMLVCIFKDDPFAPIPKTSTEMLLYCLLIFLRNEKQKQSMTALKMSLREFVNENYVLDCILRLARFSYETLMERTIVFESEEGEILEELERNGLLLKMTRGESGKTCYQFLHLNLQELFAAFYLLTTKKPSKFRKVS